MEDFFEGARYGKEIYEPNDEDVPRKKQKLSRREEREKERQLFHGAFKGGFSVGHFGTVGSKEGFQPKTFKSSRKDQNHSERIRQTVEDFIDSEVEYRTRRDYRNTVFSSLSL
ncbi:uncharacterized protein LOC136035108 [Artemia franciscana]|uniref:uncharacterized protein LOC136035108 n=1 Tax=Artemia franciscana TaxID=6661 RepID=UPI0032DA94D0